jgi:hypothetical protein
MISTRSDISVHDGILWQIVKCAVARNQKPSSFAQQVTPLLSVWTMKDKPGRKLRRHLGAVGQQPCGHLQSGSQPMGAGHRFHLPKVTT